MSTFQRVADVDTIPVGQGKRLTVGDKEIALFRVDDEFYAIENNCSHRGGPLADGRLAGLVVTCPWHGAQFDITSGQAQAAPAPTGVASYATKVEDGGVWVDIS